MLLGPGSVARLLAPAKINLHLRVGSPAPDGFHPLMSWMCTVALFDTLEVSRLAKGDGKSLVYMTCDDPALPCDATNLIVRAGAALAEAIAADRPTRVGDNALVGREVTEETVGVFGVKVALRKRIPFGAGLGGGSSDGATAMIGLNRVWSAGFDRDRLAALSARCGSDLPFFFYGGSSICTGRGQVVRPTPPPVARWAALFLPDVQMPTPRVYRVFDEMKLGHPRHLAAELVDWVAWAKLPAEELLPLLVNDLESPAFAINPQLGRLRSELETDLGRPVRMSGSGSSLFTLFGNEADAVRVAESVSGKYHVRSVAVEVSPKISDDLNDL